MSKKKKALLANAELEVEKIYEQYEEEIKDAYENHDVPFEDCFCFTEVVDLYPSFKGPREDPLFNGLTDNYEVWYEKIWTDIEAGKQKCNCSTCTKNSFLTAECERVLRQREQKVPFRTCPLCKKNIPHKHFDKENGHIKVTGFPKILSSLEVTCDSVRVAIGRKKMV